MRNAIVFLLGLGLGLPLVAQDALSKTAAAFQEKVLRTPVGTRVEVRLKNKRPVQGNMADLIPGGFIVRDWVAGGPRDEHRILFEEVTAIKIPNPRRAELRGFVRITARVAATMAITTVVGRALH